MEDNSKKDGRSKNGGVRKGAGRKKGTGVDARNKVVRFPSKIIAEAEAKGVKNLTKMIVDGVSKELKKVPYPSGSEPASKRKKGGSTGPSVNA